MKKNKRLRQAKQSLLRLKGKIKDKKENIKVKIKEKRDRIREKINGKRLNIAIVLTCIRIILTPVIMAALLIGKEKTATVLFLTAILTDFLDGYFARKEKQETFVGKMLDPIADKLLINLTAVALAIKFGFPLWALIVFLVKDASMIIIGTYLFFKNINKIMDVTIFAKATTVIQMVSIMIFFIPSELFAKNAAVLADIKIGSIFIACFFTLYTAIDYAFRLYKQKLRKREEFHFKVLLKLPDYITLMNALCGLIAIFFAFYKMFSYSCMLMLLSVVFDYLDGKVAREIQREGNFGKELDSLTDVFSFGVAPAVFGISLLLASYLEIIAIFVFMVCGILRLARYNVIDMKGIYYGMPITFNAVVIALLYFTSRYFGFELTWLPYVYLALGLLMISPFKIKKR